MQLLQSQTALAETADVLQHGSWQDTWYTEQQVTHCSHKHASRHQVCVLLDSYMMKVRATEKISETPVIPAVGQAGRPGVAGHGGVGGVPPRPSPGSALQ